MRLRRSRVGNSLPAVGSARFDKTSIRRVATLSTELERYIAGMSAVRGKPQLVEIDEDLLKAVKAEANRRGMTYRAFFEAALARELKASRKVKTPEQLQLAS